MIDRDLERRLIDCRELLQIWHDFHNYFVLAVKGGENITHEREAEFLRLKSRIAMLHDSFMESLKHDQAIGQHILSIVERAITLKHINKISTAEIKKIEIEWHESYLLLSETVASMEEDVETLAEVNPTKYKMRKFKESSILALKNFFSGPLFKILLVVIGIPVLLIIVNQFWSFSNLKKYKATKKFYYKAVDVFRIINPGLPYERFDDIKRNTEERPDTLKEGDTKYTKTSAAGLFSSAGIAGALNSPDVDFTEEAFRIKNSSAELHILMFKFKGDNQNENADDVVSQFNDWKVSLSPSNRKIIDNYYDFFRKNNVVIAIQSPRESERKHFKEIEFGVMD